MTKRVVLPPCALVEGTSKDYSFEPEPDEIALQSEPPAPARPSFAELISEAQAQIDAPPFGGILGLLSDR